MSYTFSDFGGLKVDYDEIENPNTDRTADEVNKAFASIASSCSVIPDYVIVLRGVSDADLAVVFVRSQYPNISVDDISITFGEDGLYYINLPSTVITNMGVTKTTSIEFTSLTNNFKYTSFYHAIEVDTETDNQIIQLQFYKIASDGTFTVKDDVADGEIITINVWTT
jgi:hypothetical protein